MLKMLARLCSFSMSLAVVAYGIVLCQRASRWTGSTRIGADTLMYAYVLGVLAVIAAVFASKRSSDSTAASMVKNWAPLAFAVSALAFILFLHMSGVVTAMGHE
ncbi:hypothetical protein FNU76_21765 [Chitinimonas arctica]|uniref:DUF4134 domain-containing protein n=1 Tax=Chitinimonas arctica TaxID=2594795 RepID=A0A516SKT2_9NEIS|nr:hypothetical protein [Chitinimonas arctica]QDQ28766.1 hypothetical protein FNU76_21765 [Chitinimonas arctica]